MRITYNTLGRPTTSGRVFVDGLGYVKILDRNIQEARAVRGRICWELRTVHATGALRGTADYALGDPWSP